MKKTMILLTVLAMVLTLAGCNGAAADPVQTSTSPATAAAPETTAAPGTTAPESTEPAATDAPEVTEGTTPATQAANPPAETPDDGYLASLQAEAKRLEASLAQEELTQSEMNAISQELYELWDDALNEVWGKLRNTMPEYEFDQLLDEQLAWIADKETAVEEAGKSAQGGSIAPLLANMKAAEMTEARVYELYEFMK